MDQPHTKPTQQLDGYELVDCIGSGAYGEVWRANAPGGLTKAIKYVFGQLDDRRATSELKALQRVKQVRHPYLLSLERIEIIDGRLVVVTELADNSLRDRFRECVQAGLPGIPRDELLRGLAEAAEALDYLAQQHELQHLDVKPENLLLLAGHVKVADFGLVKSMNERQQQSLVGGMTPLYAAPEVFQSAPSWHSDQYSLAVMYQELLTGELPYNGVSTAELTMQHLHDEPDLSSLSEGDRFVISRALSKDPKHRYDSCAEMAKALAAANTSPDLPSPAVPTRPSSAQKETARVAGSATEIFSGGDSDEWSQIKAKSPILIDLPPVDDEAVTIADPLVVDTQSFTPAPAVFIGLGGLGGQVLSRLRAKFNECGDDAPAATMLLLDTDSRALQAAVRGTPGGGQLTPEETMLLPLRRPQEYRDKASLMLQWLSRRWLYNIPRSLRTEGIRPLGRLALLDHVRQAMQRIRAALASAVEEDHTRQHGGNADRLRVYIVSSITGGTGGAMTTDVAYAVRAILARIGVSNPTITGLMLNGSARGAKRGELARVNAFAWLAENEHFARSTAGYPGDESAGLPAHEPGVPVFDNTYLLELGTGLGANEIACGVNSAAAYLFQDAATPAQIALDAGRNTGNAKPGELRTCQIESVASAPEEECRLATSRILAWLANQWSGDADVPNSDSTSGTSHIVRGAATLVSKLQLDAAGLASACRTEIEKTSPDAILDQLAAPFVDELLSDLENRLVDPTERFEGADNAAVWFQQHLACVERDLTTLCEQERAKVQSASAPSAKLNLNQASLRLAIAVTKQLQNKLTVARESIAALIRSLATARDSVPAIDNGSRNEPWQQIADERMEAMISEADQLLLADLRAQQARLLTTDPSLLSDSLARHVVGLVRGVISRTLTGISTTTPTTTEVLGKRVPPLARFGSVVRRVLVASIQPNHASLFGDVGQATRVHSPIGPACLIVEGENLSLPHVAGNLVDKRRDYVELASRVQTRNDIRWASLLSTPTEEDEPTPAPMAYEATGNTVVPTSLLT